MENIRMGEVKSGDVVVFAEKRRIVKMVFPRGAAICLLVVDLPEQKDNMIVGHHSHLIWRE